MRGAVLLTGLPARVGAGLRRAARFACAGDAVTGAGMALLVAYYCVTPGVFQGKHSGDGFFGFQYLNALVHHGTLDMKSVIPGHLPYFGTHPVTGLMPNRTPFGPVLVWMPFYLLASAVAWLSERLGAVGPLPPDSALHAWVTGLGTLAAVVLGYRQLFILLRRHLGAGPARVGAAVAVWATPVAWYAAVQPFYQHGCAFGAVALLVERWDASRGQASPRRFALLGALGGLAASMRLQEAIFLLPPVLELTLGALRRREERRRWLGAGIALAAGALLVFLPQLAVWHAYTGGLGPPQTEPLRWGQPQILTALFSTRSGLFPWSPVAYASLIGLWLGRRHPTLIPVLLGLTCAFLVNLYVVSCAWVLHAGYGFGARRLSDAAPLLGLGAALFWSRASRRSARRALAGYLGLCVLLTAVGMELQRHRRVASSGGYARTAGRYLRQAGAPDALARLLETTGYPFVQPAGWLFALRYRVSPSAFEGVVGNFFLAREGQWLTLLPDELSLPLDRDHASHVAEGLDMPASGDTPSRVTGPIRLLLPFFFVEPVRVIVHGTIPAGPMSASWQGRQLSVSRARQGIVLEVPAQAVRVGVNELMLELPAGAVLERLTFDSLGGGARR